MGTVYLIHNTVNGKYYVGKTVKRLNKRWNTHRRDARLGSKTYLHRAMRKYGIDKFAIHPLMSLTNDSDLQHWERFFIALFKTRDRQYGYNLTEGGDGAAGYKHGPLTAEHRRKLSIAHMGKLKGTKRPADVVKRIADANRGKISPLRGIPLSMNTRRKLSLSKTGKTHSEETGQRLSLVTQIQHASVAAQRPFVLSGLCQCGCGLRTPIVTKTSRKHDRIKGDPCRFISGHNMKLGVTPWA